jgi:hypothetical protein
MLVAVLAPLHWSTCLMVLQNLSSVRGSAVGGPMPLVNSALLFNLKELDQVLA